MIGQTVTDLARLLEPELVNAHMAARYLTSILLIVTVLSIPMVHADPTPYVIPLEGARWASPTIQVHISGGQEWQQNQTLQAMQIWNYAQLWFSQTYFPNSSTYTLEVGDSSAQVQVDLFNASVIVENIQGWTSYHAKSGVMQSAKVTIASMNSERAVLVLALHEFGHVLGLGDDVVCCKQDLMNAFAVTNNVSALPTTLDLYALHILETMNPIPSFVWLPNNIPYETSTPIPAFQINRELGEGYPIEGMREDSSYVHLACSWSIICRALRR